MEPTTAIGTGLAIIGSKDLLTKLLGPTADYVGGEVKNFVDKCNINLDSIFNKAYKKLGRKIEEPGNVNPRVLKHVIDEGRFCEDELTSEYYGGILASARNPNERDDRGVSLLAVVKDLSVYQLRLHYLVYTCINRLFKGKKYNLGDNSDCHKMRLFIPMSVYESAMDFSPTENPGSILSHAVIGLNKHDLISDYKYGHKEFIKKKEPILDDGGILLTPTLPGAELFVWSLGFQGGTGRELLDIDIQGAIKDVVINEGAIAIEELKGNKS